MPGPPRAAPIRHDLVLVGGGHAHVQVLRRLAMRPLAGLHTTIVVDVPVAAYSGMVPGFVAGQYEQSSLEIDVRPLARRANAAVVVARALGVDARSRRLEIEGRPPLRYDTASFDIGSTVAGLDLPGARDTALATRPIARFLAQADALVARARGNGGVRVVVVGAGAGGVELALALRARLVREDAAGSVTLVESGPRILPELAPRVAARVERALRKRGVALRTRHRVVSVEPERLRFEAGEALAFDALVWAPGAASHDLFRASGLPTDERGFVRVRPTLQVEAHDDLFAAGDCARFEPPLAKAGVYAVRQGPVLAHNLRARIEGRPLRRYRAQRDFLVLLNACDGTAIGTKWGRSVAGRAVFACKDRIDRGFVERFQVLGPDDRPTGALPPMQTPAEMRCGGCAAKLGEPMLHRALARLGVRHDPTVLLGLATPDDAAAVATPRGDVVVATVDAFRAFTDDPWLVGRVAAVNALSDVFAVGAVPRWALAWVAVPDGGDGERAEETLFQVLAGVRAALDADGVALVGGHTTAGEELSVGLAVWGHPAGGPGDARRGGPPLLQLGGLSPGDRLILTKPLGTGVLFAADAQGRARGPWIEAALGSMMRSNAAAARVMRAVGATAATDVSGFGLVGHLAGMLRASKASARLPLELVPLLPGARGCLALGLRSTFHPENARARSTLAIAPAAAGQPALEALFDPQTSGGLLFGVPAARADEAVARLREDGDGAAACIGTVEPPRPDAALVEVLAGNRLGGP